MDELKAGKDCALDTQEAIEIVRTLSPRFPPGKAQQGTLLECELSSPR